MKPGVAFVVAAVAALAAPSLASAAVLTLDQRCYTTGSTISLSGSGFTDNGEVKLGGAANSTVTTDAGGDFSNVAVTAPDVRTAKPKRFTITATDKARPSVKARVRVRVSRGPFWSNAPVDGVTTDTVTWRFAGFDPRLPIFSHLRFRNKTVDTHRFGVAGGACGVLTARALRVPGAGRLHKGAWTLKLDQKRRYSAKAPGRVVTFDVGPRR